MEEHHGAPPSPLGWMMVIGGGVVAQATPTTPVGTAGLIASVAGLLMALFQYYSKWMDGKNHEKHIQEQAGQIRKLEGKLQETQAGLEAARDGRHKDANRLGNEILELKIKILELQGKFGITDKSHAIAINANADNINAVAEKTGTQLPVDIPHVEPTNGDHPKETP